MKNLVNPNASGTDIALPIAGDASERTVEIDFSAIGERRTVLLVEDDAIIVQLLQDVLEGSGFTVRVAKYAADALEQFLQHRDQTCCVILDYGIPGMHAARLLERFIEIDPDVRVILSSGYPQNFIVEDFPLERISGFLAKPYDPRVLIGELRRLVLEHRSDTGSGR